MIYAAMKIIPLNLVYILFFEFFWSTVFAIRPEESPPIGGFPSSSTAGIFVALAVPIDLPHRNVYVSYNFEANYNIIGSAEDVLPGPLHFFLPTRLKEPIATTSSPDAYWSSLQWPYGTIERKLKEHKKDKLLSRQTFYTILNDKFKKAGYEGEPCMLKLICEANDTKIHENNGILGNLFHVLFSPTTSRDEDLPDIYYEAENNGRNHKCDEYHSKCPDSILDIISITINSFL